MSQAPPAPHPPSVDTVLNSVVARVAIARFGHTATANAVRHALEQVRANPVPSSQHDRSASAIATAALTLLECADMPTVRPVFNLTGTVLHTNLGRAILSEAAVHAAVEAMRRPVALEYDLETGKRGERDDHVRGLIREITGAEDACLVNNNAAAVLLVLAALGAGRETIVSRGELIEIGGAFRLPDIMARAGTKLVEVGTTNRTHLRDYENAITGDTALLMKAHTSNYIVQGFTTAVEAKDLAPLAKARNISLINDLGSGTLVDLTRYGLKPEPTVQQALQDGSDIVTFSGDKLLGGPQCGIIAGRRDLIAKVAKHPMKRALRLDKIRLAALEATFKLYRDPDSLPRHLPTLAFFVRSADDLRAQAIRLLTPLTTAAGPAFAVTVIDCKSQIGSGALPLDTLASAGIAIAPVNKKGAGTRLEALTLALRKLPRPVIGRISDDAFILDLRCLDDEAGFIQQLSHLAFPAGGNNA
ncbi:MAG: L-seryl-tRNA(Sec) selenium transferase [Hyphomicrobiaceae bacterium]